MIENDKSEVREELRQKLGNFIEDLRSKKNFGFNQLALKSGINVRSLNEIIYGKAKRINPFHLQKIAKALNIDYKELYKIVGYLDENEKGHSNIEVATDYKTVPLYSSISAGYGCTESEVLDYIALPLINGFSGDIFAVRVNGDSMEHTIEDKSIVFIKRDEEVFNKKIGAFILNGQALLKRYFCIDGSIFLRSDNRDYPDIRIEEYDDFIVVGKYIGSVINEDII